MEQREHKQEMEIDYLTFKEEDLASKVSFLYQKSVKETWRLHTHDFYEIFYVLKGRAIHEVNSEKYALVQGTLVLMRPSDIHQYKFINDYDMEIISIGVHTEIMKDVCEYLRLDEQRFYASVLPPLMFLEGAYYWDILKKLFMIEKKKPGKEREQYFRSIFSEIAYQFYCVGNDIQQLVFPVWLVNLTEEMSEKENYLIGLERMIEIANMSQEHMTREFKRFFGITPTEFINIKRVNYGAELLLERKYSIIEVCYMCGFNNLSYFYKIFEKIYHCTPKKFLADNFIKEQGLF